MNELNRNVLQALQTLDDDFEMEEARAKVRARLTAHAAEGSGATPLTVRRTTRSAAWSLSRAAGILLLTAAGAYALPGSPVRRWVRDVTAPEANRTPAPAAVAPAITSAPEATGVRLSVPSGALRVVLQDVQAGSEVRVLVVPGTEAAVFAPAGSRFTSAAGRLEARVTPGEVRVELPRGVDPVSLEVGGRIYLRSTGAGLDISGPVASRTDDEIVFRIPGS